MGRELPFYRRQTAGIVDLVSDHFNVPRSQVYEHTRLRTVTQARQLAMYLSRLVCGWSYPEVGIAFGRDHTTIMSACKRVADLRANNANYNILVERMLAHLTEVRRAQPQVHLPHATEIVFSERVWHRLRQLEQSGMFGGSLNEVVERLVAMQLFELDERSKQ